MSADLKKLKALLEQCQRHIDSEPQRMSALEVAAIDYGYRASQCDAHSGPKHQAYEQRRLVAWVVLATARSTPATLGAMSRELRQALLSLDLLTAVEQ